MSETISIIAACVSAAAACASAYFAYANKINNDADNRLIYSIPINPNLKSPATAHSDCVIQCDLFNKSKRKAFIDSVNAYDRKGIPIEITWSDTINDLGMPLNPSGLIGIVDLAKLYVRRIDGNEFEYAKIEIHHSFSDTSLVVTFDKYASFINEENDL